MGYPPQWADKYGPRWYLHYDGHPPHDDESDYRWNGSLWVREDLDDDLDLEDFEERKRRRIAEENEY